MQPGSEDNLSNTWVSVKTRENKPLTVPSNAAWESPEVFYFRHYKEINYLRNGTFQQPCHVTSSIIKMAVVRNRYQKWKNIYDN